MAKANAKDLLLHGDQLLEKGKEVEDPSVVTVGVTATSGDHKTVVVSNHIVPGEFSGEWTVLIPSLPVLPKHFREDAKVTAVFLLHVLGVRRAEKNTEPQTAAHRR